MFIVNNASSPFYLGYLVSGNANGSGLVLSGVVSPMTYVSGLAVSGGVYYSLNWVVSGGTPPTLGASPLGFASGINPTSMLSASINLIVSGIVG